MSVITLPPKVRVWVYLITALGGVTLTAASAGYAAYGHGQPVALVVAWAVYGSLSAAVNTMASGRVPESDDHEPRRALEETPPVNADPPLVAYAEGDTQPQLPPQLRKGF